MAEHPSSVQAGESKVMHSVMAFQGGHLLSTEEAPYALNVDYPSNLQPGLLNRYEFCSEMWQLFLVHRARVNASGPDVAGSGRGRIEEEERPLEETPRKVWARQQLVDLEPDEVDSPNTKRRLVQMKETDQKMKKCTEVIKEQEKMEELCDNQELLESYVILRRQQRKGKV